MQANAGSPWPGAKRKMSFGGRRSKGSAGPPRRAGWAGLVDDRDRRARLAPRCMPGRQDWPHPARRRGLSQRRSRTDQPKNSHASPTRSRRRRVYVHFGAHGTACLSSRGDILWRIDDLQDDHRHGPAGSPVVWRDRLIFNCDGEPTRSRRGRRQIPDGYRWRADREGRMAYSTPRDLHRWRRSDRSAPAEGSAVASMRRRPEKNGAIALVGDS